MHGARPQGAPAVTDCDAHQGMGVSADAPRPSTLITFHPGAGDTNMPCVQNEEAAVPEVYVTS